MRLYVPWIMSGIFLSVACSSNGKKQEATLPTPIDTTAKAVAAASATPTPIAPEKKDPKDEVTCERGKENRTLRIETVQPKGCKLWYSQYGTKDPVASSKIANTHCEKVRTAIRGHLENAHFKCSPGDPVPKTEIASAKKVETTQTKASASPIPSASASPGTTPSPVKK